LLRLRLLGHFTLAAEDTAPFLVVGDGHTAFHAYTDALFGFGFPEEQFLQERHVVTR
jgi:hypothetical protein